MHILYQLFTITRIICSIFIFSLASSLSFFLVLSPRTHSLCEFAFLCVRFRFPPLSLTLVLVLHSRYIHGDLIISAFVLSLSLHQCWSHYRYIGIVLLGRRYSSFSDVVVCFAFAVALLLCCEIVLIMLGQCIPFFLLCSHTMLWWSPNASKSHFPRLGFWCSIIQVSFKPHYLFFVFFLKHSPFTLQCMLPF